MKFRINNILLFGKKGLKIKSKGFSNLKHNFTQKTLIYEKLILKFDLI